VDPVLRGMAFFIEYPVFAAVIGVLLFWLGRIARRRTAVTIGVLWLLYAVYETAMHERWLCSGECNIRIDLLAIYPALLIGSLAAAISLLRSPRRPQPPA
jgi:formate hydrogenlyase subunit 3/multisubunit Na+/H+ antiporter MnhD subunit